MRSSSRYGATRALDALSCLDLHKSVKKDSFVCATCIKARQEDMLLISTKGGVGATGSRAVGDQSSSNENRDDQADNRLAEDLVQDDDLPDDSVKKGCST